MQSEAKIAALEPADLTGLDLPQALGLVRSLTETVAQLQHQLDWFKRQLFGSKSERFIAPDPLQMHLGEALPLPSAPSPREKTIPAHTRKVAQSVSGNCPAFPVPRSSPDLVQVRSQRIVAEVLLP